jgi:hypothetical protein
MHGRASFNFISQNIRTNASIPKESLKTYGETQNLRNGQPAEDKLSS